jgi:hypothetical protein
MGDWNGNGISTVGYYNPSAAGWYLYNSNANVAVAASFGFGAPGTNWQPIVGNWTALGVPQLAAGNRLPATATVTPLTPGALAPIIAAAIDDWAAAGASATVLNQMSQAQFVIGTLAGNNLGQTRGNEIYLDQTADGYGWFIDPTPMNNGEFIAAGGHQFKAISPQAVDHIDLLTVVEHELGHIAGLGDQTNGQPDLMDQTLGAGVRREPSPADVDAIFRNL